MEKYGLYGQIVSAAFTNAVLTTAMQSKNTIEYVGYQNSNTTYPITLHIQGRDVNGNVFHQEMAKAPRVASLTGTATINLDYAKGDIFVIHQEIELPTTATFVCNPSALPFGKSIAVFMKVPANKVIKFVNSIIIDTRAGTDYTSGYYCTTFSKVRSGVDCISVWKTPGIIQTSNITV